MSKLIKKIAKLISYILLPVFLLPVITLLVIQIPVVEQYIIGKVLNLASEKLGTEIQYSRVRITSFNQFRFNDLLLPDPAGDTLIYAQRTVVVIPVIFSILADNEPDRPIIKRLNLKDANLKLQKDTSGILNLQFLIDIMKQGKDSSKVAKPFRIKEIELENCTFQMALSHNESKSQGIRFSRMKLTDLNILTRDLYFFRDTVSMDIQKLEFKERSGFITQSFTGLMELCQSYLHFSDIHIQTQKSTVTAGQINMDFLSYRSFQPATLFQEVKFDMVFDETRVNTTDIGYFTDYFWNNDQEVMLSGQFHGNLSNLKGKDFSFGWGNSSYLSGDFTTDGLPRLKETFLIINLEELLTNTRDLENLKIPGGTKLTLPANLEKLKNFRYQGNFTGFLNDFVANGRLSTNQGNIYTDLMFSPDSSNRIRFSGRVKTNQFLLGELFNSEDLLGDIAMDVVMNGHLTKDGPVSAEIDGQISRFTFRGYPYRNIRVDGNISNKRFKGMLDVIDPNLTMQFDGLLDLAAIPRQYDFTANIIDANLTELKISDADPNYHASFLVEAKAQGKTFDELNGEIRLLNSLFTKSDKQIQVYGLSMIIRNEEEFNELILRSDILDANISGQYRLTSIKDDLMNFLERYIPAVIDREKPGGEMKAWNSQINFDFKFKRTLPFFDFFFPDYLLAEGSEASGVFLSGTNGLMKLDMTSPELKVMNNAWKGLMVNVWSENSTLYANMGSQQYSLNQLFELENFTVETSTSHNEMLYATRWLNWDSALYKGTISGAVSFLYSQPRLALTIGIDSSSLTVSDSIWQLNRSTIAYDTTGIFIDNLELRHNKQYLFASGRLSEAPGDSLDIEFRNFDLAHLNFITGKKDFDFRGRLNGTSKLTGVKRNPLFFSSMVITGLMMNGQDFGNCMINSIWDNRKQSLRVDAEAQRGTLTMLKFSGDYFPGQNGKMDFHISLNKLKVDIFNPFLSGVFTDMRGLASGELLLTGFRGKPSLNGNLKLQKNAFTIDYLKTRYNFTTRVEVVNNNFLLSDVELFDSEGNLARLNGIIHTEYLKDISLNLSIDARKFQSLNTREYDNSMFYGTAYTTGLIKIKGPPSDLVLNIDVKTEPNTRFFIPLAEETEVSEYGFINFIRNDTSNAGSELAEQNYKVDLSGIQMQFNLDVTPDAEVQIIFDSKMGDIIKAEGTGRMQMSVNTLGSFELIGEYTISRGDYLFTMQDVINKRLKIQEGSNLRWTGDPLNAEVDINAVYRTRASLTDLLGNTETGYTEGKVTVDCRINLKDQLLSPTVLYDLYLPYAEEETRTRVESKIGSEEEVTKQFLALMVMNRFLPATQENNLAYNPGVNASELLSNQLSNWLSQISSDVDIGVNYRPGSRGVDDNEVEVALSTQLMNDRLSINGSVGTNAEAQNTTAYMGDLDVDYKLTRNGKWRARTFIRTTDDQIVTSSTYIAGVGMLYMEEFNTLPDLLSAKKKKQKSDDGKLEEEEE
jgi:hypothetical protein